MARSRVGGTKGKLSGALGDSIFYIVQETDGSYAQVVQSRPDYRYNPNTDAQACSRLTMATIERAMQTFRDFITSGWENILDGSMSAQEFSRYNYNELRGLVDFWWPEEEIGDIFYDFPKKGQNGARDGVFTLSRGSLPNTMFWAQQFHAMGNPDFAIISCDYHGSGSVGSWLMQNQMMAGDQWVFVRFMKGKTASKSAVVYVIVETAKNVNPNAILTNSNWRKYISVTSNVVVNAYFDNPTKKLVISFTAGDAYGFKGVSTYGLRKKRVTAQKVCYSTCKLDYFAVDPFISNGWQTLDKVRPSWLNE